MVIDSDSPPANPIADFEDFFKTYEEIPNEFKYRKKISEAYSRDEHFITVLFEDILNYNPSLANYLKNTPEQALEEAVEAFKNILRIDAGGVFNPDQPYFVRISTQNNSGEVKLRAIRAKHIDHLIYVRGIVIRAGKVIPQIINAAYECPMCGNIMTVPQIAGRLSQPADCANPNCQNKKDFIIRTEDSEFIDYQKITVQEAPEELRPGSVPQTLVVILLYDLVDAVRPGERVKVMGVLKSYPTEDNRGKSTTLFKTQLMTNNIEGMSQEEEDVDLTVQDVEEIRALAREPAIQKKIARSIARTIMGHEHLKLAAALSLFSGNEKHKKDGSRIRGDIHVLFMGDPGTGKSQILQNCAQIATRAIYTSGKGASAAGLTAAVVRESETSGLQLEAGALVLASGGSACIDEFDKMKEADRVAIHEAMEQQSYHPSFKLWQSNRKSIIIGDFIDKLFATKSERSIEGKDCDILLTQDLNYSIISTNFKEEIILPIHRVSRHKAPDYFHKITYSNGRSIIVTPEHPIYCFENNKIITLDACKISNGAFVPGPRSIQYSGEYNLITHINSGSKDVKLPIRIDLNLSKFLGYFITEGYSYLGSSAEIGLSNTDPWIIEDMKSVIFNCFGVEPIDNTERNRTIRIISKSIYEYLQINFPECMKKSHEKGIPPPIFCESEEIRCAFLTSAFNGDGGVESTGIAYSTNSIDLAYDYQDLLSTVNIHSRISHEQYYFGPNQTEERTRYKIYITGDSLQIFDQKILSNSPKREQAKILIQKSSETLRNHDVLPTEIANIIISCLADLGIPYDGYFYDHLKNQYGINIRIVQNYLELFEKRIKEIKEKIQFCNSIKELRKLLGYSQKKMADLIGVNRGKISYLEQNGYSEKEKRLYLEKISVEYLKIIDRVYLNIFKINEFTRFRWLKISSIEIIENNGEYKTDWVYDVTIEPTENFISHGLILHNTVSIAKAGIVATLQSKTSIIAAANPKTGRYDDYKSASENINLSPPILSRFDLIFIVRDRPDKNNDDKIAEYILSSHMEGFDETYVEEDPAKKKAVTEEDFIPMELFKKYIRYAKNTCHPKLTKKAAERIKDFYVQMRNSQPEGSNAISIVARNLEGIIRMCEAYAKMALRDFVNEDDAIDVIELVKRSLHDVGYDAETGTIDMDRLLTGTGRNKQAKINKILDKIKELQEDNPKIPLTFEDVYTPLASEGIDEKFLHEIIAELLKDGTLFEPETGTFLMSKAAKGSGGKKGGHKKGNTDNPEV